MINEIVRLAFQQAVEETPNVSKTGLSKHISKKIEENDKSKIYSYKTFSRYYDKYILGKEGIIDRPQAEIIEELCNYLGYGSYEAFVSTLKAKDGFQMLDNNNIKVEYSEIQSVLTEEENSEAKELTEALFFNKNLIKQLVLTIILILFFKINWTDKECLFCLEEYSMKPKTQSGIYNEVMFEKSEKLSDTAFIFYKMEDLCYGIESQSLSF